MTEIQTFQGTIKNLSDITEAIDKLAEEWHPEKAYLISHELSKIADDSKKKHYAEFKNYFDWNKELPGGYRCQIVPGRRTYAFEEDREWRAIKEKLDAREAMLKETSDAALGGKTLVDSETGEILPFVKIKWTSEAYRVTKK